MTDTPKFSPRTMELARKLERHAAAKLQAAGRTVWYDAENDRWVLEPEGPTEPSLEQPVPRRRWWQRR